MPQVADTHPPTQPTTTSLFAPSSSWLAGLRRVLAAAGVAVVHAAGWFGRGSTRGKVEEYNERNKRYLSRPARKQKDYIEASRSIMENTNDYNIWYCHRHTPS